MSTPILFACKTPPIVIGKPEATMMDLIAQSCVSNLHDDPPAVRPLLLTHFQIQFYLQKGTTSKRTARSWWATLWIPTLSLANEVVYRLASSSAVRWTILRLKDPVLKNVF
jgi:hypothetical protein